MIPSRNDASIVAQALRDKAIQWSRTNGGDCRHSGHLAGNVSVSTYPKVVLGEVAKNTENHTMKHNGDMQVAAKKPGSSPSPARWHWHMHTYTSTYTYSTMQCPQCPRGYATPKVLGL